MTINLVLCAKEVFRDADTENLAIIGLLDGIAVGGFPLLIMNLAVLVVLERDPAVDPAEVDGNCELRLGDTVLIRAEIRPNFRDKARTRVILRVEGLVVPAPGVLLVNVSFNEGRLASQYSFPIERLAEQRPQLVVAPAGQPAAPTGQPAQ